MNKIKLLKENFKDNRGKIIDVFVNSPKEHCLIVTFTKGAVRGNHYHKKSTQFSFVLNGKLDFYFAKIDICNLQVGQVVDTYNFDNEEDLHGFNNALNKVSTIPHSNSIKEAWLKTEVAIKSYHVVERNSNKFNDEKVMKKMAKYE